MNQYIKLLVVLAFLFNSVKSNAALTIQNYLDLDKKSGTDSSMLIDVYFSGLMDGLGSANTFAKADAKIFCPPTELPMGGDLLKSIIDKGLEDYEGDQNKEIRKVMLVSIVAIRRLQEIFPC